MKFLLYANNLGKSKTNGTAITILIKDLSNFLTKKGFDVIVAGNKNIVEEDINAPYYFLGSKGFGDLEYSVNLAKLIKKFNPDVVHAFMKPMTINLAISKFFHNSKKTLYLGSFHNSDNYSKYSKPIHYPYRFFIKKILEKLDFVSGPSNTILNDIKKTYFISQKKLVIVPNFIDFFKIEQKSQENTEIKDEYIINIGRLEYQKNHEHLIKAFYKIKEEFPKLKLLIIGEGSLKQKLITLAKDLGIKDRVIFLGYQNNPWKYLKKSKAFVMSSYFEGLPLVLIESLYLKIPIVAYDIEPVREISENGKYAVLSKSFDIDDLSKKIKLLLKNPTLYTTLKEEGYKKALEFSMENYLNAIYKLKDLKNG